MKKIFFAQLIIVLYCLVTILPPQKVFADYVMPYPSVMPGNKIYILYEFADKIKEWWSFGSLAGFSYHLMIADKKLIETKTLFEYKQYLLATKALPLYEYHLIYAQKSLINAQLEDKDINQKNMLFKDAIRKHKEILESLKTGLPNKYTWVEENRSAKELLIYEMIDHAISIGEKCSEKSYVD